MILMLNEILTYNVVVCLAIIDISFFKAFFEGRVFCVVYGLWFGSHDCMANGH
jgi:hypothetical protein